MNILKLTLAAATFSVALAASASAMPVGNIGSVDTGISSAQPEQVRLVCNRFGRCWRTGGYVYRGVDGAVAVAVAWWPWPSLLR